jgi:hypothetical protein
MGTGSRAESTGPHLDRLLLTYRGFGGISCNPGGWRNSTATTGWANQALWVGSARCTASVRAPEAKHCRRSHANKAPALKLPRKPLPRQTGNTPRVATREHAPHVRRDQALGRKWL